MERSADYYLLLLPLGWVFTLHGTVKADCSLLNFHWFPPDGLWGFESRPPSIRKDVKYRGRWTITEEEEKRRRSVEGSGVSFRVKMIVLKYDKMFLCLLREHGVNNSSQVCVSFTTVYISDQSKWWNYQLEKNVRKNIKKLWNPHKHMLGVEMVF